MKFTRIAADAEGRAEPPRGPVLRPHARRNFEECRLSSSVLMNAHSTGLPVWAAGTDGHHETADAKAVAAVYIAARPDGSRPVRNRICDGDAAPKGTVWTLVV